MEKFVLSLFISSLTMAAVSFVYMLFLRILKDRWSAKWRYYTWVMIFAGFLVPYRVSFGSSAVNIDVKGQAIGVGSVGQYALPSETLDILQMVFIVWAVGAALFIIKTISAQYMFVQSVKRFSHQAETKAYTLVDELADELSIWQKIKTVRLKEISSPMIVGFFTPTIILPQKDFTQEELRLILKHELTHFKNRDLFIKAFMLLAQAVNWFNPFLKLFVRSAEQQCEMYCDEIVMAGESEYHKKLYCQSILNTVSRASDENEQELCLKPVLSSSFNISREGLKQRLKTILSVKKKYKLGIISGVMAALIVMSGTVFAFSEGHKYSTAENMPSNTSVVYNFTYGTAAAEISKEEEVAITTTFATTIGLDD